MSEPPATIGAQTPVDPSELSASPTTLEELINYLHLTHITDLQFIRDVDLTNYADRHPLDLPPRDDLTNALSRPSSAVLPILLEWLIWMHLAYGSISTSRPSPSLNSAISTPQRLNAYNAYNGQERLASAPHVERLLAAENWLISTFQITDFLDNLYQRLDAIPVNASAADAQTIINSINFDASCMNQDIHETTLERAFVQALPGYVQRAFSTVYLNPNKISLSGFTIKISRYLYAIDWVTSYEKSHPSHSSKTTTTTTLTTAATTTTPSLTTSSLDKKSTGCINNKLGRCLYGDKCFRSREPQDLSTTASPFTPLTRTPPAQTTSTPTPTTNTTTPTTKGLAAISNSQDLATELITLLHHPQDRLPHRRRSST
ncbi:hypothetical protein FOL47_001140 [Perkinsus chesapeaki]|uniref:Uncharacterized protein n=1 Tax=Perkinsus chesapeaki TaxID=330153 RepID=A0A7J6KTM4_PERCH|nr:hypothetical protein FOL47_001140 [Perkinsus chesapeaki]